MKKTLYFLLFVVLFASCSDSSIVIWTDQNQMILYADVYNKIQDRYKINIVYKEFPSRSVVKDTSRVDLVVGRELNNPQTMQKMKTLNRFLSKNAMANDFFYSELLKQGLYGSRNKLVPLAFNIPCLIYSKDTTIPIGEDHVLLSDCLSDKTDILITRNLVFFLLNENSFKKDLSKISDKTLEDMKLIYEKNPVIFEHLENTSKHLIILKDKKTNSVAENFNFYNGIPKFYKDQLEFVWIKNEDKITVGSNAVYAGVPEAAENPEAAFAFLQWFLDYDNQNKLLFLAQKNRKEDFGIFGGFSSIQDVSQLVFPDYFKDLKNRVPFDQDIRVVYPVTENLNALYEQVMIDWVFENLQGNNSLNLELEITRWLNSRPIN